MKKIFVSALIFMLSFCVIAEASSVMLKFDNDFTDSAGNTWTPTGKPVISDINPKGAASLRPALQLDGKSFLQAEGGISLGGKDFTIDGWAFIDTNCGSYGRIFEFNTEARGSKNLILSRYGGGSDLIFQADNNNKSVAYCVDKLFHFAYVYEDAKETVSLYINGKLQGSIKAKLPERKYELAYIGKSSWDSDGLFVGYIYDFRITDGQALWTENFTPEKSDEKPEAEIVMLKFDKDFTELKSSGGTWKPHGNNKPVVSEINIKGAASLRPALQLNGESYLQAENGISLGGRDFTIDGWAFMDTNCGSYGRIFEFNVAAKSSKNLILSRYGGGSDLTFYAENNSKTVSNLVDKLFHFAVVYDHKKTIAWLYINGELKTKIDTAIPRRYYSLAYLGKSSWDSDGLFAGYIYDFRVTDGKKLWDENFTPPTVTEEPVKESAVLHFSSDTKDSAGNEWTSNGNVEISTSNPQGAASSRPALQLDGESYLQAEDGISLGGRDFTIDGWAFIDKKCGSYGRIFEFNVAAKNGKNLILSRYGGGSDLTFYAENNSKTVSNLVDKLFHFAVVYEHRKSIAWLYINGELKTKIDVTIPRRHYALAYLGKSSWDSDGLFVGYIYEFKVTDGKALWTDNFEPPAEYSPLKLDEPKPQKPEESRSSIIHMPTTPVKPKTSSPFDGIFNKQTKPEPKNKNEKFRNIF